MLNKYNKSKMLLLSVGAILLLCVGTTVAYLISVTNEITNSFHPTEVVPVVEETFNKKEKSDVLVKNDGTTDAYIRAKVVVTWQDEDGNVYGDMPRAKESDSDEAYDYVIKYSDSTKWILGADDIYYYTDILEPGAKTENLIDSCVPSKDGAPEGYALSVEILADAIQAKGVSNGTPTGTKGKSPVEIAWGVTVDKDGKLSI